MTGATDQKPASRGPRRGERLEVEIDSLAFGGRGLARADGFVLFVAGALPGDRASSAGGEESAVDVPEDGFDRLKHAVQRI